MNTITNKKNSRRQPMKMTGNYYWIENSERVKRQKKLEILNRKNKEMKN